MIIFIRKDFQSIFEWLESFYDAATSSLNKSERPKSKSKSFWGWWVVKRKKTWENFFCLAPRKNVQKCLDGFCVFNAWAFFLLMADNFSQNIKSCFKENQSKPQLEPIRLRSCYLEIKFEQHLLRQSSWLPWLKPMKQWISHHDRCFIAKYF